jgi:hypothetical protein
MELLLAGTPTEEFVLWASPPCNAGKRRNWNYRVLGLLQTPVDGANNFRRLYVKRFGVLPVGKRVFVRVRQQTNGWRASRGKAARLSPRGRADRGAEANDRAEERIEEYKRNTSGIRAEHRRNTSDQHADTRLCARHARSNLPVTRLIPLRWRQYQDARASPLPAEAGVRREVGRIGECRRRWRNSQNSQLTDLSPMA